MTKITTHACGSVDFWVPYVGSWIICIMWRTDEGLTADDIAQRFIEEAKRVFANRYQHIGYNQDRRFKSANYVPPLQKVHALTIKRP